jgi:hypothetical protein
LRQPVFLPKGLYLPGISGNHVRVSSPPALSGDFELELEGYFTGTDGNLFGGTSLATRLAFLGGNFMVGEVAFPCPAPTGQGFLRVRRLNSITQVSFNGSVLGFGFATGTVVLDYLGDKGDYLSTVFGLRASLKRIRLLSGGVLDTGPLTTQAHGAASWVAASGQICTVVAAGDDYAMLRSFAGVRGDGVDDGLFAVLPSSISAARIFMFWESLGNASSGTTFARGVSMYPSAGNSYSAGGLEPLAFNSGVPRAGSANANFLDFQSGSHFYEASASGSNVLIRSSNANEASRADWTPWAVDRLALFNTTPLNRGARGILRWVGIAPYSMTDEQRDQLVGWMVANRGAQDLS